MKVLVACEESQTVCIAFREKGHEAYSADILPCSGGHPEWHIQGDCLPLLEKDWDLIIAHPPCTYLSNAGARFLHAGGSLNQDRFSLGSAAAAFFMKFLECKCPMVCVENPLPSRVYRLPEYDQIIEPYFFGEHYKKRTALWLKGLPLLEATEILPKPDSTRVAGTWFNKGGKARRQVRSKTFKGIAEAMASQWGKK